MYSCFVKFSERRDALKAKEILANADKNGRIEVAKIENNAKVQIAKYEKDSRVQEAKWKARTTASHSVQRTMNLRYLQRGGTLSGQCDSCGFADHMLTRRLI